MADFKYFTKAQFKKLMATIKRDKSTEAYRDLQWITIMRYTGIRLCVMRQFTVEDARVCLATGRFSARAETNKGGVKKVRDKVTKEIIGSIIVPSKKVDLLLVEKVADALTELIALNMDMIAADGNYCLVLSRRGRDLSARQYQERFAYWKKQAGLNDCDDVTVHGLRHTYAVEWLKAAKAQTGDALKSVKQLQKNMNHSSITSTMIYLSQMGKEELELIEQAAGR